MIIQNCKITGADSKVIKDCVMSKDSELYRLYRGYHTGIDLSGSSVFSMYDGVVVQIGNSTKGRSVIVRTGSSFCVVYSNLSEVSDIQAGQDITSGYRIGSVKSHVHVEYLTLSESIWPVRIGRTTWYKNDVSCLIYGSPLVSNVENSRLFSSLNINEMSDYPSGIDTEVSQESDYILSNNRGD